MNDQTSQRSTALETVWRVLLWCVVAFAVVLHFAQFAGLPSFFQNFAVLLTRTVADTRGPVRYRVDATDESSLPGPLGFQVGDILQRFAPARPEARYGEAAELNPTPGQRRLR